MKNIKTNKFILILAFVGIITSCSLEKNMLMKNPDGDFVVLAYGKTLQEAEKSAYASMNRKCSNNLAVVKSIDTQYIGAIGEAENKIATKVLDFVEQISSNNGVTIPVDIENEENYRSEIVFTCDMK